MPRYVLTAIVTIAVSTCIACSGDGLRAQSLQETSKDIIAAHIRTQGFACDKPVSAERDRALAKPDEQAWQLTCEDHTYLVRLIPDMAAQVRRIN